MHLSLPASYRRPSSTICPPRAGVWPSRACAWFLNSNAWFCRISTFWCFLIFHFFFVIFCVFCCLGFCLLDYMWSKQLVETFVTRSVMVPLFTVSLLGITTTVHFQLQPLFGSCCWSQVGVQIGSPFDLCAPFAFITALCGLLR
jgi:hypothetical protein